MDRNRDEALRWLSQARHDLQVARLNAEHGAHAWACFLCQQAAEKALKAYLYAQGQGPVIGHSSFVLAQRCAEFDSRYAQALPWSKTLDTFYIPTRYPNGLPGGVPYEVYDVEDSTRALDAATAVLALVEADPIWTTPPQADPTKR